MKKTILLASLVLAVGFGFALFHPVSAATTTTTVSSSVSSSASSGSCAYACCSNSGYQGSGGCQLNEANNDTVCYFPGTPASYCGNPLPAGQTPLSGCAFPTSGFNPAGWAAIDATCADMFNSTAKNCYLPGSNCSASTYSNPTAATLCEEPGTFPAIGYCIGAETPANSGCVEPLPESEVAAGVGATCSGSSTGSPVGIGSGPTGITTTGGTTSSGGGAANTGSITSSVPPGSGSAYQQSISSSLTPIAQGLNSLGVQIVSNNNAAAAAGTSNSGSTGTSMTQSTSVSANTLLSVTESLESLATVLSNGGNNLSPATLASIQSLITSITQLVGSLSASASTQ